MKRIRITTIRHNGRHSWEFKNAKGESWPEYDKKKKWMEELNFGRNDLFTHIQITHSPDYAELRGLVFYYKDVEIGRLGTIGDIKVS